MTTRRFSKADIKRKKVAVSKGVKKCLSMPILSVVRRTTDHRTSWTFEVSVRAMERLMAMSAESQSLIAARLNLTHENKALRAALDSARDEIRQLNENIERINLNAREGPPRFNGSYEGTHPPVRQITPDEKLLEKKRSEERRARSKDHAAVDPESARLVEATEVATYATPGSRITFATTRKRRG